MVTNRSDIRDGNAQHMSVHCTLLQAVSDIEATLYDARRYLLSHLRLLQGSVAVQLDTM